MKCPNADKDPACGELEEFTIGGKDNYASNTEHEIHVGRIAVLACPNCGYFDDPYFI